MTERGVRKRAVLGAATAAIALGTLLAAPGSAQATAGGYCGTYAAGYSSQPLDVRTVFVKQPPGCLDFNLTWVSRSAYYGAFYWDSAGNPHASSTTAKYHAANDNWCQVLMSNVTTGTRMIVVASDNSRGYSVHTNL